MSEKIWKIFGILGIIFLFLILVWAVFSSLFAMKLTKLRHGMGQTLREISLPAKSPSLFVEKEETVFKTENEPPSRMIIKTGWLNLVVKDIVETIKKISKFAEDNGGWVVSSNVLEDEKVPSGSITVRVPVGKFEEAINFFRNLAVRVSNERTQSQDITEEYVDLEARLKNLEASENQLLELMKRTGRVSEILEVQRELTNVRQQIEQIKGRMQYLEQSVKMSSITINLALSEELLPVPPAEKWRPKYVLLQSWKNVMTFWRELSYFLIKIFVWSQVWIPFAFLIWWAKKIWIRHKMSKV